MNQSALPNPQSAIDTAHRERLQHLQDRYNRAIGDEGRAHIETLITSENARYNLSLVGRVPSRGVPPQP